MIGRSAWDPGSRCLLVVSLSVVKLCALVCATGGQPHQGDAATVPCELLSKCFADGSNAAHAMKLTSGLVLFLCACHSTCRGLHWWEVVEQETVLEVMVEAGLGGPGGLELAERLHALLLPSYYPGPEEGPVSGTCWHQQLHRPVPAAAATVCLLNLHVRSVCGLV